MATGDCSEMVSGDIVDTESGRRAKASRCRNGGGGRNDEEGATERELMPLCMWYVLQRFVPVMSSLLLLSARAPSRREMRPDDAGRMCAGDVRVQSLRGCD